MYFAPVGHTVVEVTKASNPSQPPDSFWDHEMRIRILERDYAEIEGIRTDVRSMQIELSSVKQTVQSFPEFVRQAIHVEMSAYKSRILALILTVVGSMLYLVGDKALDYFIK